MMSDAVQGQIYHPLIYVTLSAAVYKQLLPCTATALFFILVGNNEVTLNVTQAGGLQGAFAAPPPRLRKAAAFEPAAKSFFL